ncbi:MAG TPA: TlpA disulfide reductase family protein [Gemmataceae bacterium]|nr:TlpA disulfide reductase family protein [Gemmataceae bacterium]
MRTLPRGVMLLLIGAALIGCVANSTHTTRSVTRKRSDIDKRADAAKPAKEIRGIDADGKSFQLSEYRGKVVLLDFWASWCGPCRSMFPHERSLVQKYEGRPFAFLGIDEDDDRETLQKAQKEHKLNWRSWWDEGGSVAREWQVRGFPTLYLIDHKGLIRWHEVGVPEDLKKMDELIERLVKEAESEDGKQAALSRK